MQIDYHITTVDRSKPMEANEKIKAIDWNCDGTLLAFGGKDKAITIWNPKHTTKPEYSYSVNNTVLQIKWSPVDKNVIACTMERDTLKIWDVKNEKFSFTITLTGYPDHMCWSPDGSYITVLNDKGALFMVDAKQGKVLHETNVKYSICNDIFMIKDSRYDVLFASKDDQQRAAVPIQSYDPDQGFADSNLIPVGYGECVSMDIDCTQKQMCTASTDKFCYAMNLQCCCVSSRIRCPVAAKRVRFTSRCKYIAISGENHLISLVDPGNEKIKLSFSISEYSDLFACNPERGTIAVVMGKKDDRKINYYVEIVKFEFSVCLTSFGMFDKCFTFC